MLVPSTPEIFLSITGLSLTTDVPATVLLQPRQNTNQNFGFPDQFNVMVITTARNQMLVRIERADANGGWGQDLRLDLLIVDQVKLASTGAAHSAKAKVALQISLAPPPAEYLGILGTLRGGRLGRCGIFRLVAHFDSR